VIVPDGLGGVFISWEDDISGSVRIQRLDSTGRGVWQSGGIQVANSPFYQASPRAVSDGSGGVIVAWIDGRDGFCSVGFKGSCDIFAQRLDATGQYLWTAVGVPVAQVSNTPLAPEGFAMISDQAGGAIMAWEQGDPLLCCTIHAQRIDSAGSPVWVVNGIQVSPTPTIVIGGIGAPPQMVSDGAGGAIASWWNIQYVPATHDPTISAQRISPTGQLMWASAGVTVVPLLWQNDQQYSMTSDGKGGAIFAGANPNITVIPSIWTVTVQRVGPDGQMTWGTGIGLTDEHIPAISPSMAADGNGGVFVTWQGQDSQGGPYHIRTHHVGADGIPKWPSRVEIVTVPQGSNGPQVIVDGTGGVVTFWTDCRNGTIDNCGNELSLYGQRIDANGRIKWQDQGYPISSGTGNRGIIYPGDATGFTVISDGSGGAVLAWPDGRHNPCSVDPAIGECDLFAQHVKF
jgi:hypothetical protein